jgi:hypothetical protein
MSARRWRQAATPAASNTLPPCIWNHRGRRCVRVGGREEERVTAVLHLGYNPIEDFTRVCWALHWLPEAPLLRYAKSRLLQDDRGRRGAFHYRATTFSLPRHNVFTTAPQRFHYRATTFSRCMRAPLPSFSRDVV